jgi:hypothetical protein
MPDNIPMQYGTSQAISDPSNLMPPPAEHILPTQLQPIEE